MPLFKVGSEDKLNKKFVVAQPRSQDLYPGLGASQGKGPGNEVGSG